MLCKLSEIPTCSFYSLNRVELSALVSVGKERDSTNVTKLVKKQTHHSSITVEVLNNFTHTFVGVMNLNSLFGVCSHSKILMFRYENVEILPQGIEL